MADILIGTATTDENGQALFSNLPPGTYKYVQTTTKNGYTVDATEYTIVISDAVPVVEERINAPTETGAITVTKHVEGYPDFALSGATFKLTDSTDKVLLTESASTGETGQITFNNLMSITDTPQSYKVVEVTAPANYEPNTTEYTVEVTVNTTQEQDVPNTPTTAGALEVNLSDANYEEYGLDGAGIQLFRVTE